MAAIGIDLSWEQIRAKHNNMYLNAQNRYKSQQRFEPGQIASCKGSIRLTFFRSLLNIGVKVTEKEIAIKAKVPLRYCVINRHIKDDIYEVFLLTTFGGAKNMDDLSSLARHFGMPVGNTKWYNEIRGIIITPPIFGVEKSSFVFAIPTTQRVIPTFKKSRMPPGELDRLRDFSNFKLKMLPEDQKALRTKLKLEFPGKRAHADLRDDFKPIPRKMHIFTEGFDDMRHFIPNSAIISSSFKPKRLGLLDYNNINWPLRYVIEDFNISKSLQHLAQRRVGDRAFLLPKPYYAPRLPISLKKVWRSIL